MEMAIIWDIAQGRDPQMPNQTTPSGTPPIGHLKRVQVAAPTGGSLVWVYQATPDLPLTDTFFLSCPKKQKKYLHLSSFSALTSNTRVLVDTL